VNLTDIPVVKQVFESGADDRVYDSLVLAGPILIAVILLVGRSLITLGLALSYVALFVFYLAYKGIIDADGDV